MEVSITLSGGAKTGTVQAQKMRANGECLLIDIRTDLHGEFGKVPVENCRLYLHGSTDAVRAFAEKIIAALPDDPQAEALECMEPVGARQ